MTITAGTARKPKRPAPSPASVRPAVGPAGGSRGPTPTGKRPRRRHWAGVPARLRLLRAVTVLLVTGLALLLTLAGLSASGTWNAVAGRDAPRTTSAADLELALNDMDAQVANLLLANGDAGKGRLRTPYEKAVGFYGDARDEIGHDLRTLAVAAQGDRGDERTVESLTDSFAEYQELVGRALENDRRTGGRADALADYRRATDLVQGQLLPEARDLVSSNNAVFNSEYVSASSALSAQLFAVVALGVLLLVVLGSLQWYLSRRFQRTLNAGLLAASVCALLAVLLGAQLLSATREDLHGARRDAFDSVVALSRARAIAYDANADESRYLLDPQRREQYARAFLAKSQELYGVEGASLGTYDSQLAATWREYRADHQVLRFTGEFRRELDNITFAGERSAAEKTVETYAVYQRDDRTIRKLLAEGDESGAVEFCMGWEPGTSNAHFEAWMGALGDVTAINQGHFDRFVDAGRSDVGELLPSALGALLAAAALTVLGLRARFAEFR